MMKWMSSGGCWHGVLDGWRLVGGGRGLRFALQRDGNGLRGAVAD